MPERRNSHVGRISTVQPYLDLVRAFVVGDLDTNGFKRTFLDRYSHHRGFFPDGIYDVLQDIFWAIEDYVEYDHLRDPGELDADQFRARVAELEPELIARFEDARRRENRRPTGEDR